IPLQILVRDDHREPAALARITAQLQSIGLEVTGSGRATVSARAAPQVFEKLFGRPAPTGTSRPAATDETALPIPPALRGRVASITVAPKHTFMDPQDQQGGS